MTPPAATPAPRPSLAQLAAQTPEQHAEQLRRALPNGSAARPHVAAFQSSI